jgi:hypothetical protein
VTQSGHKLKLEIKKYIPKQLSTLRVTQGWCIYKKLEQQLGSKIEPELSLGFLFPHRQSTFNTKSCLTLEIRKKVKLQLKPDFRPKVQLGTLYTIAKQFLTLRVV